jgi:trehalose 6-phosphate synthase
VSRLVVVSNRVAHPREARAGGLATAMHAALSETGGVWFGWSGKIDDARAGELHVDRSGGITYATIDLGQEDFDAYYNGFANRTLWPLLHHRLDLLDYQRGNYTGYLEVNRLFAERLAKLIEPDDVIWVHDYHLIPLAQLLRGHGLGNRMGFFLHTPLPTGELMSSLPRHRELFDALASYDLVGLQTAANLRAFRDYARHEMGGTVADDDSIVAPSGRRFRAGAFPIGIDVGAVEQAAATAFRQNPVQRLRASLQGRTLAIGVDRLDYSKGIPQRFEAFGDFLANHPERHGKVTLLQIAPTSRGEVLEYRQIANRLSQLAGAINGYYADPDWVPIRYVNKSFHQATLAGYYRLAQIGLITPLRDGMNLVAKEYVAAQEPENPGVLILSQFAGAAHEMREALLVNPYDIQDVAEAIEQALVMPKPERAERWQAMMQTLRDNDITAWRKRFLATLQDGS